MKIQYITCAGWQNGYFQLLKSIAGELPGKPESAAEILGVTNDSDAVTTVRRLLSEGNQVFVDSHMLSDSLIDNIAHSVPSEAFMRFYMVTLKPNEGFPVSSLSC